jgi:hypothetical protein
MVVRKTEAVFAQAASGLKIVPVILAAADEPARVNKHHKRECCNQGKPPESLLPSARALKIKPHRIIPRGGNKSPYSARAFPQFNCAAGTPSLGID